MVTWVFDYTPACSAASRIDMTVNWISMIVYGSVLTFWRECVHDNPLQADNDNATMAAKYSISEDERKYILWALTFWFPWLDWSHLKMNSALGKWHFSGFVDKAPYSNLISIAWCILTFTRLRHFILKACKISSYFLEKSLLLGAWSSSLPFIINGSNEKSSPF